MKTLEQAMCTFIIGSLLLMAIFLLGGCKMQTVVVPEIHKEYVHDTINRVDSVWRDRVHVEYMRGDTVVLRDSVYLYQYKTLDKIVERIQRDSIPYEVEVEKQVRYVPGFYKWSTWVCWIIIVVLLLYGAWRIIKVIYLRK